MSEETNSFIDKKNYLRLLYSIRENMQKYSKGEKEVMEEGYQRAVHAVELIVQGELDVAMNEYNKKIVKE